MPTDREALLLQISADVRGLEKQFAKARGIVDGGSRGMERRAKALNDNIGREFARGKVSDALGALGAQAGFATAGLSKFGAAGLATAGAVGALAVALNSGRQALAFADEIGDAAQKIGVTTDTLQEFRYAISQTGGEAKDADEALSGFTQTLGKAVALPTAKTLKPFKALGLDPKELGEADAALKIVLDRLGRVQDEAQRQALAKALGLEKFIPLAREGAARIDELRAAAQKLGYVMDASLIAKAGEAKDKLDALEQVVRVQLNSALVDLAPLILSIAQALASAARAVNGFAGKLSDLGKFANDSGLLTLVQRLGQIAALADPLSGAKRLAGQAFDAAAGYSRRANLRSGINDLLAGKPVDTSAMAPLARAGGGPPIDLVDVSGGGKGSRGSRAAKAHDNTATATAQVSGALMAASRDALEAMSNLTENTEARARIATEILKLETLGKIAQIEREKAEIKADDGLSAATKAALTKKLDQVAVQTEINALLEQTAADQETANKLQDEMLDSQREIAGYYDQIASIEAGSARTAKERRAIELKALGHRQRNERTDLEARLSRDVASGKITQSEAAARLNGQRDLHVVERNDVIESTKGPLESYFDGLPQTVDEVNERLENMAAEGLQSVVDGLAGAAAGMNSLGDVAKRLLQQLTYDFTKLNLERLLGMGEGGSGGAGGFLKSLFKLGGASVGGGFTSASGNADLAGLFANGTDSAPGGLSLVGERGPELVNLPRGAQVIPNDILKGLSRRGPAGASHSFAPTLHINLTLGGAVRPSDVRRTGAQLGAAALRAMAQARQRGLG